MEGLIAFFVGVVVFCFVWLIVHDIQVEGRKGDSERVITKLCATRGGGVFFDVQGENKMVFACNDNHVLQVRAY